MYDSLGVVELCDVLMYIAGKQGNIYCVGAFASTRWIEAETGSENWCSPRHPVNLEMTNAPRFVPREAHSSHQDWSPRLSSSPPLPAELDASSR